LGHHFRLVFDSKRALARVAKGYGGPGYYERKNWNRDAEFVYNHIVCPPMVLWLGEASGISPILVRKAKKAALSAKPTLPAQSAAIRRVISWVSIEEKIEGAMVKLHVSMLGVE